MYHKLLIASVLGTKKYDLYKEKQFSIIYECMQVFSCK